MKIAIPSTISIIVTTYASDSLYTQGCLESIRCWKNSHHELVVVVHDESPLMRAYLDACVADGLIDKLVFAISGHGHTRSYNLGVLHTTSDVIFNICNDIVIGPSLVDDCAWRLRKEKQLGIIGWHWWSEGVVWKDNRLDGYSHDESAQMPLVHVQNIRNASWFTGRYFEAIGGTFWTNVCNTSFFGVRRDVLEAVGGGFGPEYQHFWADDFLCYAILDQGLDTQHYDAKFRRPPYFSEFRPDNIDSQNIRRHEDSLCFHNACLDSINLINGGLETEEAIFLYHLAKSIPENSVITNVGVWLGASAIILLDAMKSKHATFHFIDCFDIPGVSALSAQSPAMQDDFLQNIQPYIGEHHQINIVRANTLVLNSFPKSDFIFVDAGNTEKCIQHDSRLVKDCLNNNGTAVFHGYDQPAIKSALDKQFSKLEVYKTMAVHRRAECLREAYNWPVKA